MCTAPETRSAGPAVIFRVPREGRMSELHAQVAEILIIASVGLTTVGISRSSKRISFGP